MLAKKYLILWIFGIGLVPLLLIGCASIMSGTSQQVGFKSTPPGATITVEPSGVTGATPFTASLRKGKSYTVTAEKEGYQKEVKTIGTSFNGWFLGNILIGGLLGIIIDIADGAWMNLDRNLLDFNLQRK